MQVYERTGFTDLFLCRSAWVWVPHLEKHIWEFVHVAEQNSSWLTRSGWSRSLLFCTTDSTKTKDMKS